MIEYTYNCNILRSKTFININLSTPDCVIESLCHRVLVLFYGSIINQCIATFIKYAYKMTREDTWMSLRREF